MLMAHRNATGTDLSGSDGIARSLQWALRLGGHPQGAAANDVLRIAYGVLPPSVQPYAHWWLAEQKDQTVRGTLDAVLAFITMPSDEPKTSPEGVFKLTHHFEDAGRYVFNSSFKGADSLLGMFVTGAGRSSVPAASGGVSISGFGSTWLGWRVPEQPGDREFTGLSPLELFPAGAAKLVHERSEQDGSGVVTVRQETFVRGVVQSWFDKEHNQIARDVRLSRKPVSGVYAVRSVGIDYSKLSGAPMLVAVADRMQLVRKREVAWRLIPGASGMPRIEPGPRTDERATERSFLLGGGAAGVGLNVTYVAPENFEFRLQNEAELFQGGVVDAVVYRRSTTEEQAARRSALAAKDAARIKETSRLGGRDEVDDHGARPVNDMELADNLIEEIKEGEEGVPPPVTFLVIMTLQQGAAPTVETLTRGEFPSARVGKRLIRFDGTNVVFSSEAPPAQ
jgi:hypothetical protein